jgi:hypothetical protein
MAKESDEKIAQRGVGGHLKAGVQNIKNTYKALYNREGPGGGAKTGATNLKIIATGKAGKTDVGKKFSPSTRAKIAVVGATSVTPLGPLVAIGMGIKKSIDDKKKAKENIQARTPVRPNTPPPTPTTTTTTTTTKTTSTTGTTAKTPTTGTKPTTTTLKPTSSFSSKTPLTSTKTPGGTGAPKLGQHKPKSK